MSKKLIRSDMRKLMKCMNYALKKSEEYKEYYADSNKILSKRYHDIYQLLGSHAWSFISDNCEHEYRKSKRYPTGKCKLCGLIKKESK